VGGRGRRGHADLIDKGAQVCGLGPRGLERDELVVTQSGEGSARSAAGESRGSRIVDDVGRLGPVEHAQGDAQVGVGADAVVDGTVGALGGEHEVHPEAAAALGHVDQRIEEPGQLRREGGELVDDHDEAGDAHGTGCRRDGGEVGDPRVAEELLAAPDLGIEGGERTSRQVLVEVGDQPDHVGQLGAGIEGAAALVVDEQE